MSNFRLRMTYWHVVGLHGYTALRGNRVFHALEDLLVFGTEVFCNADGRLCQPTVKLTQRHSQNPTQDKLTSTLQVRSLLQPAGRCGVVGRRQQSCNSKRAWCV
eukprot:4871299-Pleurochrysis_carterae.AAC.1